MNARVHATGTHFFRTCVAIIAVTWSFPNTVAAQPRTPIGTERPNFEGAQANMVAPPDVAQTPPPRPPFRPHATLWASPTAPLSVVVTGISVFSTGGEIVLADHVAAHVRVAYARGFALPSPAYPTLTFDESFEATTGVDFYPDRRTMGIVFGGPRIAVRTENRVDSMTGADTALVITPALEAGLRWFVGHLMIAIALGVGWDLVLSHSNPRGNEGGFAARVDLLRLGVGI